MKRKIASLLCGATFAGFAVAAVAAPIAISNGAFSGTVVRNCPVGRCLESNPATFSGTIVQAIDSYAPGGATASTVATNPLAIRPEGRSNSSVLVFDAASSAPIARQGGFANGPTARTSSRTFSVSGYGWDGNGPRNRTINLSLNYFGTNVKDGTRPGSDTDPFSSLNVQANVFSLASSTFVVDDRAYGGGPWCAFDYFALATCLGRQRADFRNEGFALELGSLPDQTSVTGALAFTLEPGRFYFLELWTAAYAKYDSYMDATHTITASFSNLSGLADLPAGAAAVPEPGSLALILVGLIGVATGRNRSRRSASTIRS